MVYCYLFEANSIQSFLFQSGKLKDVIAASERLDKLVDSNKSSVLFKVLQTTGLSNDLIAGSAEETGSSHEKFDIYFLRCKGGAFYAYGTNEGDLIRFRAAWTLTLSQLFPSLTWSDALSSGEHLLDAMNQGHIGLGACRQAPDITLPFATAICQRSQRTGKLAVPLSSAALKSSDKVEQQYESYVDIETERHRQAITNFNLKDNAALQERFTPTDLQGQLSYPIDLETDFAFSAQGIDAENQEATKDIALIHIDGNGLGILLRALQDQLTKGDEYNDERYKQGFRLFSEALSTATQEAARVATKWLHEVSAYEHKGRTYVPMRPLVLGGDDLTLLCRADLALEYSERFCLAFKQKSKEALKPLFDGFIKGSSLSSYLTASGGILYHKAGHPFTNSHQLVEELCQAAKQLTKSQCKANDEVGPAALAIYRLSNTSLNSFESLRQQTLTTTINESDKATYLEFGLCSYFVADTKDHTPPKPNFQQLRSIVEVSRREGAAISVNKWRQIMGKLALDDKNEADKMYRRAISICQQPEAIRELKRLMEAIIPEEASLEDWYWFDQTSGRYKTILKDLLTLDHFRPVLKTIENTEVAS